MDGSVVTTAVDLTTPHAPKVLPPVEDRHHAYHELALGEEKSVWLWASGLGVWRRGGRSFLPAQLAYDGWTYLRLVGTPTSQPTPLSGKTMTNVHGQEIAVENIPGRRLLEDQTVAAMVAAAQQLREALVQFKAQAFADAETFKQLLFSTYNVTASGRSGGMKLETFDGLMRVEISNATTITFGIELNAAKALIEECLTDWLAAGTGEEIKTIVMDAFKVGEGGTYSTDRVLRLRQFEFSDPRWQRAMHAIDESRRAAESRHYVRFYQREDAEKPFQQIVLDASRV